MQNNVINKVVRHGLLMRESFDFKKFAVAHWFPGHMGKGMNQLSRKLKHVDCVIEVHDARIPISGRNPIFEKTISQFKPHILVYNKVDLIDKNEVVNIQNYYRNNDESSILFTDCKSNLKSNIEELIPAVKNKVKESERFHRTNRKENLIMIIGIPNVGKSSLINALRALYLRKGKATTIGPNPGVTRSVLERIKISENPLVYVLDTPGILAPRIGNVEVGLKLALVNTIKEHLVGEDIISDYLLYRLNLEGNHSYVEHMNLDKPTDDLQELLIVHALKNNKLLKVRNFGGSSGIDVIPDKLYSARKFLKFYRSGTFGHLKLDKL